MNFLFPFNFIKILTIVQLITIVVVIYFLFKSKIFSSFQKLLLLLITFGVPILGGVVALVILLNSKSIKDRIKQ